jgi:hypothetical protein
MIARGLVMSPHFTLSGDMGFDLDPIYDASRSKRTWQDAAPFATTDGPRLNVSAGWFDAVEEVCPAAFHIASQHCYMPYFEFAADRVPPVYAPTGEVREEALWRTMIGNYADDTQDYPAPREVGVTTIRQHVLDNVAVMTLAKVEGGLDRFFEESARNQSVLARLAAEGAGTTFLPSPFEIASRISRFLSDATGALLEVLPPDADETALRAVQDSVTLELTSRLGTSPEEVKCIAMLGGMGLIHRRVYITKGGYLGVGPPDIKAGDGIWVVLGARVPFVLRRTRTSEGERLRLVGEAYVHGAMDGEMLDGQARGRIHMISIW